MKFSLRKGILTQGCEDFFKTVKWMETVPPISSEPTKVRVLLTGGSSIIIFLFMAYLTFTSGSFGGGVETGGDQLLFYSCFQTVTVNSCLIFF